MKLARALTALMLLIMDVSFSAAAQTPSGTETGIEGVITISPTKPGPVRVDAPASQPLANATFVVERENAEVASFTTDDHGRFRVQLPPGHYKVSIKGRKTTIGRFGPFEVDVVADKMTSVQWNCDSGIR
jgi:Carboxypeptidase regulatory-like domain